MSQIISPETMCPRTETLEVTFSYTKRNERVNLSSFEGYVLDIDGILYQNHEQRETKKLTIIGGDTSSLGHAITNEVSGYYMSNTQRVTLYEILKFLSYYRDNATVYSSNLKLNELCQATYNNYCG